MATHECYREVAQNTPKTRLRDLDRIPLPTAAYIYKFILLPTNLGMLASHLELVSSYLQLCSKTYCKLLWCCYGYRMVLIWLFGFKFFFAGSVVTVHIGNGWFGFFIPLFDSGMQVTACNRIWRFTPQSSPLLPHCVCVCISFTSLCILLIGVEIPKENLRRFDHGPVHYSRFILCRWG